MNEFARAVQSTNINIKNIPRYYEFIKHPMDLATVRQKILEKQYASLDAFGDDLELMHSNCVLYNTYDAPVTQDCNVLQDVWTPVLEQQQAKTKGSGRGAKKERNSGRGAKGHTKQSSTVGPVKSEHEWTWAEKEALLLQIGELAPDEMAQVVQIVSEQTDLTARDVEGEGDVVLDLGDMPAATLCKLQQVVMASHKVQGQQKGVTPLATQREPNTAGQGDSVQHDTTSERTGEGGSAKQGGEGCNKRSAMPQTREALAALAAQTAANTDAALQALGDELRRMNGKVILRDHQVEGALDAAGSVITSAVSRYTLEPSLVAQQLAQQLQSDNESSSDTVSSDAEEEGVPSPHIILPGATDDDGAMLAIENPGNWQLDSCGVGGSDSLVGAVSSLWDEFANKDAQQAELVKQRAELEEQLRCVRKAKEEEFRRQAQKAEEVRMQKNVEETRQRQRERLQCKMEREQQVQHVELDLQQQIMVEYENCQANKIL